MTIVRNGQKFKLTLEEMRQACKEMKAIEKKAKKRARRETMWRRLFIARDVITVIGMILIMGTCVAMGYFGLELYFGDMSYADVCKEAIKCLWLFLMGVIFVIL